MSRKALHLLLIATIIACPLFCRSNFRVCAMEYSASETTDHDECPFGSHCHESPDHEDSQDLPNDTPGNDAPCDHGPCESCQCICGGAVVVESNSILVQHDVEDTLHKITSAKCLLTSNSFFWQQCRTRAPDGVGIASCQNKCILHNSFLL